MPSEPQNPASPSGGKLADQLWFSCPECKGELQVPVALADTTGACPLCGKQVHIPAKRPAAPKAEEAPQEAAPSLLEVTAEDDPEVDHDTPRAFRGDIKLSVTGAHAKAKRGFFEIDPNEPVFPEFVPLPEPEAVGGASPEPAAPSLGFKPVQEGTLFKPLRKFTEPVPITPPLVEAVPEPTEPKPLETPAAEATAEPMVVPPSTDLSLFKPLRKYPPKARRRPEANPEVQTSRVVIPAPAPSLPPPPPAPVVRAEVPAPPPPVVRVEPPAPVVTAQAEVPAVQPVIPPAPPPPVVRLEPPAPAVIAQVEAPAVRPVIPPTPPPQPLPAVLAAASEPQPPASIPAEAPLLVALVPAVKEEPVAAVCEPVHLPAPLTARVQLPPAAVPPPAPEPTPVVPVLATPPVMEIKLPAEPPLPEPAPVQGVVVPPEPAPAPEPAPPIRIQPVRLPELVARRSEAPLRPIRIALKKTSAPVEISPPPAAPPLPPPPVAEVPPETAPLLVAESGPEEMDHQVRIGGVVMPRYTLIPRGSQLMLWGRRAAIVLLILSPFALFSDLYMPHVRRFMAWADEMQRSRVHLDEIQKQMAENRSNPSARGLRKDAVEALRHEWTKLTTRPKAAEGSAADRPLHPVVFRSSRLEPGAANPETDWPQLLLRNFGTFMGHSPMEGASSFILEAPDGSHWIATSVHLLGASGGVEPPVAPGKLPGALHRWRAYLPDRPDSFAEVAGSGLVSVVTADWLAMKLDATDAMLPVKPLKLRRALLKPDDAVYLVGLPYDDQSGATQHVYKGRLKSATQLDAGQFGFTVEENVDFSGFRGAPIVDEEGDVAGVLTDRSPNLLIGTKAELLAQLLERK